MFFLFFWLSSPLASSFHFTPFHSHKPLLSHISAEFPASERLTVADATWAALNVASGGGHSPAAASAVGVTKIAKSVIAPLADHNVSVFMLSTYQTDFILVCLFGSTSFFFLFFFLMQKALILSGQPVFLFGCGFVCLM